MFRRALFIAMLLVPIQLGSWGCGCDLEITTGALPNGTVGVFYAFDLDSHCGGDVWFLDGGTLPPGISLRDDGGLRGTPTQAGTFNFTVGVAEFRDSDRASKGFALTIVEP